MPSIVLHGPGWFFGTDAVLELVSAVITLLVFLFARKAYKLTDDRRYFWTSIAFGALSVALLARAAADFVFENIIRTGGGVLVKVSYSDLFLLAYGAHIALSLGAYVILASLSYKVHNKRLAAMILFALIAAMYYSNSYFRSFYMASFAVLVFIAWNQLNNYFARPLTTRLFVFLSYAFLAAAQATFLMETVEKSFYVGAQLFQLAAFLSMFLALLCIYFGKDFKLKR